MANKIPITLLTGFLGAGKTTLINKILTQEHGKHFAIIVNEFGDIGVDHHLVINTEEQIFQMNNGCVCCTLRSDLANTLHSILEAQEKYGFPLDYILFETTGLADPSPIAQTFFRVPFLQENFYLDSVLTVVDMKNILHLLNTRDEPAKQIAFADKLLFTKGKDIPKNIQRKVQETVEKLNPYAEQITTIEADQLLATHLFQRSAEKLLTMTSEDTHEHEHEHHHEHQHDHEHEHHHLHHNQVSSFSIHEKRPLDENKVSQWLNGLVYIYGQELYRYKGILNVQDSPQQIIFQGVNMTFDLNLGRSWKDVPRESVLVFIGKDLNELDIRNSFEKCFAE